MKEFPVSIFGNECLVKILEDKKIVKVASELDPIPSVDSFNKKTFIEALSNAILEKEKYFFRMYEVNTKGYFLIGRKGKEIFFNQKFENRTVEKIFMS